MSSRRGLRRPLPLLLVALVALLAASGARGEVTATHDTIISFDSQIFPRVLPRDGTAPVGIRIEGHLKGRKGQEPAALTALELGIHRAAGLFDRGLPVCNQVLIDPASTAQAMEACPGAKIGHGRVRALADFPGAPNFQFSGQVTIFNGRDEAGRRAVLLHVFNPVLRTSFVFPLTITHHSGRYRTLLATHVRIGRWSSITDFKLVLDRTYSWRGERHGFLNAGCPAPQGFSVGVSPFVLATLRFADGTHSKIPVVGSCKVSG